jgi:hypothetical protein
VKLLHGDLAYLSEPGLDKSKAPETEPEKRTRLQCYYPFYDAAEILWPPETQEAGAGSKAIIQACFP